MNIYSIRSRQIPDSPAPQQGASDLISGMPGNVSEESLVDMDFLGFVFCVKPKTLMNQVNSPESYLVYVNVAIFVDSKAWTKRRIFHETNQPLI